MRAHHPFLSAFAFPFPTFSFPLVALFTAVNQGSAEPFTLTSSNLRSGARLGLNQVYHGMGAGGRNLSPQLSWTGIPAGAKSLAITMYDPDAPKTGGWWHWVVFNIPSTVSGLPEGASRTGEMPPFAVESVTDFGEPGYGGAAPPVGDKPHRYIFTLWALDVERLSLDARAAYTEVNKELGKHKIATATLSGIYSR